MIRRGALSRHASADSGSREAVIGLAVSTGSRVNIVASYQGGAQHINGQPTTFEIYRNNVIIKQQQVSYVSYPVNAGGSLAFYNCSTILASYDVGYDGVDTLAIQTGRPNGLGGQIDLNGVSIQAVCFNK